MKRDFKKLERLARERGYTVARAGREITWRCNSYPERRGSCFLVKDAAEEIDLDHRYRLGRRNGN